MIILKKKTIRIERAPKVFFFYLFIYFFMVNSKEIGKTSNISLSKDLIDLKAHNEHRASVLKPYLFDLACPRLFAKNVIGS